MAFFLGKEPEEIIKSFIKLKLVREAKPTEAAYVLLSQKKLKELAKESDLPVSGNKKILIQRLVTLNERLLYDAVKNQDVLVCTEAGEILATDFKAKLKKAIHENYLQSIKYFEAGNYIEACKVVSSYQLEQPRQSGLGFDWNFFGGDRELMILKSISHCWPKLLDSVEESKRRSIRLAACIQFLWGGSFWVDDEVPKIDSHLGSDAAVRMLHFYAVNLYRINESIASENEFISRSYKIMDVHGELCEACISEAGKVYSTLDSLPELPLADCRCPSGCVLAFSPSL